MTPQHDRSQDDELESLVEEFSDRRVYRPTDEAGEPEDLPQAGSGTAKADPAPSSEPPAG
ncbi:MULTISPECIES: hypothetical protein [unclassified Streptomyces]|uniref:hypothetical protein n=1 Tax=unclassified Streptomyces TaxID=2593676 RepID=UPI002E13C2B6|nr:MULTISPECIES: hypothetical protein [unclassified Streptomyces]WSR22911.1 hypothetical protein OG573_29825 [Streptomyces sp. NBC_01205]